MAKVSKIVRQIKSALKAPSQKERDEAARPRDIVDLIMDDHKPLKDLIKIMKSDDGKYQQKKAAFKKFAPTLEAHAKPEEQTWYSRMKKKADLKTDGLEGDIEHGLADQLVSELKRTSSKDMFMAKVKVLAELVEHHIQEEEDDMLPAFKKKSTKEEREQLGSVYQKHQLAYL